MCYFCLGVTVWKDTFFRIRGFRVDLSTARWTEGESLSLRSYWSYMGLNGWNLIFLVGEVKS